MRKKNKTQTTKLLNLIQIILLLRRHATSHLHNHVHQQAVLKKPPSSFQYQSPIPPSRKEHRFFFLCQQQNVKILTSQTHVNFRYMYVSKILICMYSLLQNEVEFEIFLHARTNRDWCTRYSHQPWLWSCNHLVLSSVHTRNGFNEANRRGFVYTAACGKHNEVRLLNNKNEINQWSVHWKACGSLV